jgi:hypothetical protein
MAAWRKWTLDGSRHQRELIPSAEYLRMSYYEKWIAGLAELLVKSGLVTSTGVRARGQALRPRVFHLAGMGDHARR